MPEHSDFLIIGGGIAAASVGYWLAPHGRVTVLERESQPGYHSTGRSAALFMESYGTPQVRALTMASRAFFASPPDGFSEHPLISPRGAMMVATQGEEAELAAQWEVFRSVTPHARLLSSAEACALVPVLRPEKVLGAVLEPDAADMDVDAIHQGFLRGLRRAGGQVICNAEVTALQREGDVWQVQAGGQTYAAPVVINAAGAWADVVAALAGVPTIGLEPRRRSAFIFAPPEGISSAAWPLAASIDEGWYFKPDAGMLLGSPANADPVAFQLKLLGEADIAVGGQPEGIALTPNGKQLWVGDLSAPHVRIVDTATLKTIATLPVDPVAIRVAISPDGKTAVTSNIQSGTLTLIDVASRKILRTVSVSGQKEAGQVTILFSRDGKRLYAAETYRNEVAEIDMKSGKVLRRLPAGKNGDGLGIAP